LLFDLMLPANITSIQGDLGLLERGTGH